MASKIKKILTYVLLSILVLSNIPNSVYASSQKITYKVEEIKPYAEQVEWYYRYVDGREQQRLWSYTYGRWITDWIWS
jgi:hypothetical protein